MEAALAALETSDIASWLRGARWGYAAVNGMHIFGMALLVGAILPLDLRLLGCWPGVSRSALVRVLAPVAATGLAIAVAAGFLLFSVRAREYADIGFLQAKLALVLIGAAAALILHRACGFGLDDASPRRLALHAVLSMVCWLGALACGRLIAFAAV